MDTIITSALSKFYGNRRGIDRLNLNIPQGCRYGFLGPNGAGKTTTIRLMLGLLKPSEGSATILGLDCWRQGPKIKRDLGYLAGDLRLHHWLTLRNGIGIVNGIRGRDDTDRALSLAEQLELNPQVPVRSMSRGMRQKMGLILACMHRPKVLILDEPTTALDPLIKQQVHQILIEASLGGTTVFFSSHTLSDVERLCQRVAIIKQGCLVTEASLADLRKQAKRQVKLIWEQNTQPSLPACLDLISKEGLVWNCWLTGNTPPLIQWASGQPIKDMEIGAPDLDHVFRTFYSGESQ